MLRFRKDFIAKVRFATVDCATDKAPAKWVRQFRNLSGWSLPVESDSKSRMCKVLERSVNLRNCHPFSEQDIICVEPMEALETH